jgi:bacterioferritin
MSRKDTFLEKMNEALSWELAGIVQYMNHATMLTGTEKSHLEDFFEDASEEALDHSQIVGHKISALGGVPTVEPARIRQAADPEGMLKAALKLEREALQTYEEALEYADAANKGTAFWLEDHISEEQEHVDELILLTKEVSFGEQDLPTGASQTG